MTGLFRLLPAFMRTTAFRLTLLSAGLFAFSSIVILSLVYATSAGAALRRADNEVAEEAEALAKRFSEDGLMSANRYILRRSVGGGEFLYLLVTPEGRRMSGNISGLPVDNPDGDGRVEFTYDRAPVSDEDDTQVEGRQGRGLILDLEEGYRLFVGVDVQEENEIVGGLLNAILLASALALAMGLVVGAIVSRRFARRLDSINDVARDVMAGKLQTRAAVNGSGDELDELSTNFNDMLDRVQHLMHQMRTAGDSIAHDLRMPLTRMRGRLESSLVAEGNLEEREAALEQAISDTDELLKTFNAVLSLSRLQAGERRRAFEPLNPSELLQDLAELYEPVCEEAGLDFTSDLAGDLVLKGDRELVLQAIANLLDNAVKYTPEKGAIALRTRRCSSGGIELSVTDTGPGIPAPDRTRVLERFVRLDSSRSEIGVGLGLSLVHAITEVHGAQLELDDGPGGEGSEAPGLRVALIFPSHKDSS